MSFDNRSGLLIAVAGFATLSVGDAVIKSLAGAWPVTAVAALRFTIGAVALSTLLYAKEGPAGFRPRHPWLQLARAACLSVSTLTFFAAIYVMPLAETMAITFLSPVITALLSGPLLKEKVGARVWIASGVALIGVVMILRPNLLELGPAAFLPLIAALFFSLMIIANRASAGQGSILAMQAYLAMMAAPLLIIAAVIAKASGSAAFQFDWPSAEIAIKCAFVAFTASTAHWLVFIGTTRAGAAQVAPASYVQMLVATLLGWWFFGDVPDLITVFGATIIIAAGLYLWRSDPARRSIPRT